MSQKHELMPHDCPAALALIALPGATLLNKN
jgi:hypothetical protein